MPAIPAQDGNPGVIKYSMLEHNFDKSYTASKGDVVQQRINDSYHIFFRNIANIKRPETDLARKHVSKVITKRNGKEIYTVERIRFSWYDDILLEYLSNDALGTAGWMNKDLPVHYLMYAFPWQGHYFLLDWERLRTVWAINSQNWIDQARTQKKDGLRKIVAANPGYNTWSISVDLEILKEAGMQILVWKNKKEISEHEKKEEQKRTQIAEAQASKQN